MFKNIKVVLVSPSNGMQDDMKTEPLGLMYIEGSLKKLGVDVEMVDMSFDKKIPSADIYGFSSCTANFSRVVEYAKQLQPAYTIIGGAHASALPQEAKKFFNAVVVGPGEAVLPEILKDFCSKKQGGIYKKRVKDINSIPIPPRSILRRISYKMFGNNLRAITMITSRGCPYNCAFCSSRTVWGRGVQPRSVDNVVREIEYLQNKFDIQGFKFVDDTFTLNKSRFKKFATAFSKLNIKWLCETRVDAVDDEVLDLMFEGGCKLIDLGIESVDNVVLKHIQKQQTVTTMKKAIARIKAKNIKVKLYIIYGLPFEPKNIVQQTIDFVKETTPDFISIYTLTPYPGTDIWNNPKKYNIKRIIRDFDKYQHSLGRIDGELDFLSNVEYYDRTREQMRDERNVLKKFAMEWNKGKKI